VQNGKAGIFVDIFPFGFLFMIHSSHRVSVRGVLWATDAMRASKMPNTRYPNTVPYPERVIEYVSYYSQYYYCYMAK
jgi:hypothetical protein